MFECFVAFLIIINFIVLLFCYKLFLSMEVLHEMIKFFIIERMLKGVKKGVK